MFWNHFYENHQFITPDTSSNMANVYRITSLKFEASSTQHTESEWTTSTIKRHPTRRERKITKKKHSSWQEKDCSRQGWSTRSQWMMGNDNSSKCNYENRKQFSECLFKLVLANAICKHIHLVWLSLATTLLCPPPFKNWLRTLICNLQPVHTCDIQIDINTNISWADATPTFAKDKQFCSFAYVHVFHGHREPIGTSPWANGWAFLYMCHATHAATKNVPWDKSPMR